MKQSKFSDGFLRTTDNQTTSSYLVKRKFRQVLLDLWKSLLNSLETNIEHPRKNEFLKLDICNYDFHALDQAWKLLQKDYIFLIPERRIARQRPGYSDILKQSVNYGC
jgi:hypothetical protein